MILHEHYMKDASSKMVIHRLSAISINSKRSILTQQCLKIILNCNVNIGWGRISTHLSFFMLRMQISGYDHRFRLEVLKSAINAYEKLMQKNESNASKIYRRRDWQRNVRRKEREEKKKNWYTKGGYDSVMFITATPNSKLRKKMQNVVNKTSFRIKILEKSGKKLIKQLQQNDPFKEKACIDGLQCIVCSGPTPGNCRDTGVSYKINCSEGCDYEYTGQTGLNAYTRGKKHQQDFRAKSEKSALWKHCVNVHGCEEQPFRMKVVDRCRNDPTKRQILEAVRMQKVPLDKRMNSRSEWHTTRLPRIRIDI